MRKQKITEGEYYHIYNRGVNKQLLFHDRADYVRFLFLIIYFQSPKRFYNISRYVFSYLKRMAFAIEPKDIQEIMHDRYIELVSFCIMPNHFHILLKEIHKGGTATYMHRVLNGYAKYYNKKYGTSGHLFQGTYQAVLISNNTQLLYLSAYIHRNPRTLHEWRNKEDQYEWSSYQDYVKMNRFGNLLAQSIILDQFESQKKYALFLQSSTSKEFSLQLPNTLILEENDC
ncbi:MAG: transposase [Candidatus Nomurabacteria bacterium]|nr:transposase [Candidatus Nomurabacteria bacterium]